MPKPHDQTPDEPKRDKADEPVPAEAPKPPAPPPRLAPDSALTP